MPELEPPKSKTDMIVDLAIRAGDLRAQLGQVQTELDEARESISEYSQLCDRLGALLTGVANALKGEPPELTSHDWSDLPKVAAAVMLKLNGEGCWCGGEVGPREPGDERGLGCLEDITHDWQGEPDACSDTCAPHLHQHCSPECEVECEGCSQ